MDPSDIDLGRLRRIVGRVAPRWGLDADELLGEAALEAVVRLSRAPAGMIWRWVVLEAARRLWRQRGPLQRVSLDDSWTDEDGLTFGYARQIASIYPSDEALGERLFDETVEDQQREWRRLGVSERSRRSIEAAGALGSSR